MADTSDENTGLDVHHATANLVGHATSGVLVAAAAACPPLALLYALGIGALFLAGAAGSESSDQK